MLTQEQLMAVLECDPETGRFFWRAARPNGGRIKAGDEAGSLSRRYNAHRWVIGVSEKRYLRSRLAWLWMTGAWPEQLIDHRDGDPTNDRWTNLRLATRTQNNGNRKKQKSNCKSSLKGVEVLPYGRFRARILQHGKVFHLGVFSTEEQAHAAYMVAAKQMFGEYARGG